MRLDDYQSLAMRTAKRDTFEHDMMHVVFGVTGEAGELADCVKRHLVYGCQLDTANFREELADVLWYVALGCEVIGASLGDIASANIDKLACRYPGTYTDHHAAQRLDKAIGYES